MPYFSHTIITIGYKICYLKINNFSMSEIILYVFMKLLLFVSCQATTDIFPLIFASFLCYWEIDLTGTVPIRAPQAFLLLLFIILKNYKISHPLSHFCLRFPESQQFLSAIRNEFTSLLADFEHITENLLRQLYYILYFQTLVIQHCQNLKNQV